MSSTPSTGDLLARVSAMEGRSLLIFADLIVDRFLYGTPKRVSREAPVVILEHDREETRPGGGANAVANLASLGGRPQLVGSIGDDDAGAALLSLLEGMGVRTGRVCRRPEWATPSKTRILGGAPNTVKQQIIRYDVGKALSLDESDLEKMAQFGLEAAREIETAPLVVIFSDYGYGSVDARLAEVVRDRLPAKSISLVDSRYGLATFRGASGSTPNQEEAETLIGKQLSTPDQLVENGVELLELMQADFVLVTRGSQGMVLFERRPTEARACFLPIAGSQEVTDVTGAGDTVIGTFALAMAAGASPLEAACLANYAGGIAVMKSGTATVSPDELAGNVRNDSAPLDALTFVSLGQPRVRSSGSSR